MLDEEKPLGPEPVAIPQPNLAVTAISYVGSFFSSAISSTYHYLTTPAPYPPKITNSRITTHYKDNVVASIALPERPKQKPKPCSVLSSNVTSQKTRAPLPVLIPPVKIRKPGKNDI